MNIKSIFRRVQQLGFVYAYCITNRKYEIFVKKYNEYAYAFLALKGFKDESAVNSISIFVSTLQIPDDRIFKDPCAYCITIGSFSDYDFKREHVAEFFLLCENKILAIMPTIECMANSISNSFTHFSYPMLGRYKFLKMEYDIYLFFKNTTKDLYLEIKNMVCECMKAKKNLSKPYATLSESLSLFIKVLPNDLYVNYVAKFPQETATFLVTYTYIEELSELQTEC